MLYSRNIEIIQLKMIYINIYNICVYGRRKMLFILQIETELNELHGFS